MPVHLMPRSARTLSSAVIVATAVAAGFASPAMADTSSIAVATATATARPSRPSRWI